MAEYIEKETVIANLMEQIEKGRDTAECEATELVIKRFAEYISSFPAADVQPVDRWISVKDKLPEEIGYYLVIIGNDMLYSIDIAEYSEDRWHKHDRVIYWQDLPDYPKSINGDE